MTAIRRNAALTRQPTLTGTPPAVAADAAWHTEPVLIDGRWWYHDGTLWRELQPGRQLLSGAATLESGRRYAIDTRGGAFAVTLPADARDEATIELAEPFGINSLANNPLTVLSGQAGRMVDGNPDTWLLNVNQAVLELRYDQPSNDWQTIHPITAAAPSSTSTGGGAVAAAPATQGNYYYNVNAGGAGTWVPLTGVSGGTF